MDFYVSNDFLLDTIEVIRLAVCNRLHVGGADQDHMILYVPCIYIQEEVGFLIRFKTKSHILL